MKSIPFNKPFICGKETENIDIAFKLGKISGNGMFTQKCQSFFDEKYGFKKVLLTSSCTDALEMSALLCNIEKGDEVIIPSYTFVSTALAFVRQGAKIVFADSNSSNPNLDITKIEDLITTKTKAIVIVHYAGTSCDMNKLVALTKEHNLFLIEDAAQAIDSYFENKPLGSFGHFSTFSFHETKNIISGEGGMLVINDEKFIKRAEIIWEKGTNRAEFFRGEVNKYGWVDVGSSFLPSEITAAFLFAQLEFLTNIQNKRKEIWNRYNENLSCFSDSAFIKLPSIPEKNNGNGHMYFVLCNNINERSSLIEYLKNKGISSVFHYLSLHNSEYYKSKHDGRELNNSDRYSDTLLRLPMYYELSFSEVDYITNCIKSFYL